jgi:hypothetical protein
MLYSPTTNLQAYTLAHRIGGVQLSIFSNRQHVRLRRIVARHGRPSPGQPHDLTITATITTTTTTLVGCHRLLHDPTNQANQPGAAPTRTPALLQRGPPAVWLPPTVNPQHHATAEAVLLFCPVLDTAQLHGLGRSGHLPRHQELRYLLM